MNMPTAYFQYVYQHNLKLHFMFYKCVTYMKSYSQKGFPLALKYYYYFEAEKPEYNII